MSDTAETRLCANCNTEVQVDPLHWAYRDGKQLGICLACQARARANGVIAGTVQKRKPAAAAKPETKGEVVAASKLEVAHALKAGAASVNEHAAFVMAKVIEYATNPEHKNHLWALELLAQRILPRKLYEELGGQAAGVGSLNDKRPTFQINILPSAPAQEGRVVSVQEAETVELLPSPTE